MFQAGPYSQLIKCMIEDPLPKNSKESHIIQISDLVAYIVYIHKLLELEVGTLGNRIPSEVDAEKLEEWLQMLTPSLNLYASQQDRFGIVCYLR